MWGVSEMKIRGDSVYSFQGGGGVQHRGTGGLA